MSIILSTDSYKMTHWKMYPDRTTGVYSYFESRPGATWDETVFFGLQYILYSLAHRAVYQSDVQDAYDLAAVHFGDPNAFNYAGWMHIVEDHDGRLPLRIKAVPEGTVVPVGNVMMTVENTCSQCFWLTNYVESLLTHVWYPSTVATLSRSVKKMMKAALAATSDDPDAINFMLHDFGYRGASSHDTAAIGGAGHLLNFMGTDTVPAMDLLQVYYAAEPETLAFSVPATEHSVMTSLGFDGELDVLDTMIATFPAGILSVVADSYNIYAFTQAVIDRKEQVLARNGRFVLRPDSVTSQHRTPEALSVHLVEMLYEGFGGEVNSKGFKVLHPQVRVLWGDGIDPAGIGEILAALQAAGYSAENMVFGMGGGLLQKVNRDTQRFAFKSSAQRRWVDGEERWFDVQKNPLDASKKSKAGRLKLVRVGDRFKTVREEEPGVDVLETVFLNGDIVTTHHFDNIRARAALG